MIFYNIDILKYKYYKMNLHIQKYNENKNDYCYICLDEIDYCLIYSCECHNLLHLKCISDVTIEKCYICHKYITNVEKYDEDLNIINDIELLLYFREIFNLCYKINNMLELLNDNTNFTRILLICYIIYSCIITFLVIIPILFLNLFYNLVKIVSVKIIKFFKLKEIKTITNLLWLIFNSLYFKTIITTIFMVLLYNLVKYNNNK